MRADYPVQSLSFRKVYTPQFWLMCLSYFLFFGSFNMIIPELPDYLSSMGGENYKGLIISIFTLTAGLSRPFSGKLADTVGRVPVMVFGAVVCLAIGFLYPFIGTVSAFFMLRFFHGFSTGFTPTGTSAFIADVIPTQRRGEAMGILGVFGTVGMAAGPGLGGLIAKYFSVEIMFYCSSGFALLCTVILLGVKETLPNSQRFHLRHMRITWADVYEPRVLVPALSMILSAYSFGAVLTVIPDFSKHVGIQNKGLFFMVFTLSSILVRFIAGRASDRYGRVAIIQMSAVLMTLAMGVVGYAETRWGLLSGAVLFGMAVGMNSPTIFAWTIDLSDEKARGRAMATLYIALEIGIGLGALGAGWMFANSPANFPLVFWFAAGLSALGWLLLFSGFYKRWIKK
jgi:MFS family permease